ncbi:MAG: hypothetical protein IKP12_04370, partial [Acholeplasmatales bacterium]|nr:hypothetical protein [Acholeplasmatales bacterium]
SFRQLNAFKFNKNKGQITFNFYGLTTKPLNKGINISLFIYLILEDGTIEPTLREANCSLNEEVNKVEKITQADFSCEIIGLNSTKPYKSFELSNSNNISGIPEEGILLDPVKTDEAIEKGDLYNFTNQENKLPILFIPEIINGSSCEKEGTFKIIGNISGEIENKIEFNIPITYPEDYISKCSIDKTSNGKAEINCVMTNELIGKSLIFEQQAIRDGLNEILNLGSIKSNEEMNCTIGNITNEIIDGISEEEADKIANLTLSFRQLNSFIQIDDIISFMFYGLTTGKIESGVEIIINLYLYLEGGIRDKELRKAKCKIEKTIEPSSFGSPIQAPFKCRIEGLEKKYHTFKFFSSDFISGIPFDNEVLLDPILTDNAIKEGIILNYTLDENKDKVPTTFITQSIDGSSCGSEGTFKIIGNVTGHPINKNVKLHIPMTFPAGIESICNVPVASVGEQISIECKFAGKSTNQPIILEQRILRNGNEEILTLGRGKSESITCLNGELRAAEKMLDLHLSFRQLN